MRVRKNTFFQFQDFRIRIMPSKRVTCTNNPRKCEYHTSFEFSVGDNAVLASLAVVVDEKKIHAIVQEKEEAFATYDDAIRYVILQFAWKRYQTTLLVDIYLSQISIQPC